MAVGGDPEDEDEEGLPAAWFRIEVDPFDNVRKVSIL